MRIDAHHHLWHYSAEEYDWIDDGMGAIRRDFLPADLENTLKPLAIDGVVTVQARQTMRETRWLLGLSQKHTIIKGVVGWVPLAGPTIGEMLDELTQNRTLKGVRHVVQGEPDPAFLEGKEFNAGVREVTTRGLVYDLLVSARQLAATINFVDRHPCQVFVLDHIAKPVVQGAPSTIWQRQISELARRPNVSCKFSGVVTEVPGWQWSQELIQPYFDVVLEAFGPRRLMFGSDWPVCLVAAEYAAWLSCVEQCATALSESERGRLFGGTAADVYRLNP